MRKFAIKTLNGMTYGLFATLIVGVIFQQIGKLTGLSLLENDLYQLLQGLMGMGIGLGIGLVLDKKGLNLILTGVAGAIATAVITTINFNPFTINIGSAFPPGNPVTAYFVVILTIIISDKILLKKTPVDIILIPFLMITISLILTILLSYPLNTIMQYISTGIDKATSFSPILMSIVIAVAMGMLLTSPLSSAAIAFAVNLTGIAAGAAVVGTIIQMIGFAIQSIKDNKAGDVIAVGIGTSMLQFKNVVKNPYVWLPTIISSAIVAPFMITLFNFESTTAGAGMGSAGLVGILQSLDQMNYSTTAFISLAIIIIAGGLLVYLLDFLLRKSNKIKSGDLYIGEGI